MTTKPATQSAKKAAAPKPATTFAPSGAPEQTVADVDPSHPAVDDNPRADTTEEQNRIDFNDPGLSDAEAVAKNLGMTSPKGDDKAEG